MVTWGAVFSLPGEALRFEADSDAALRVALLTNRSADLGLWGETATAGLAQFRGGRVLGRNRRFGRLEVDLLVDFGGELAVVEVRTRRFNRLQSASDTLGAVKFNRLTRAAYRAVEALDWPGSWRMDFVALDVGLQTVVAHWYEGIEGEVEP